MVFRWLLSPSPTHGVSGPAPHDGRPPAPTSAPPTTSTAPRSVDPAFLNLSKGQQLDLVKRRQEAIDTDEYNVGTWWWVPEYFRKQYVRDDAEVLKGHTFALPAIDLDSVDRRDFEFIKTPGERYPAPMGFGSMRWAREISNSNARRRESASARQRPWGE